MNALVRDTLISAGVICAFVLAIQLGPACKQDPETTFAHGWQWRAVPIEVVAADDLGWDKELKLAIKAWNAAAGCEVFRLGDGGAVQVALGNPHPYLKGASWVTLRAGKPTEGRIVVYGVGQTQVAYVVLLHELGRVLGLGDDRTQRHSAMHPNIAEVDPLDGPGVRITSKDGEAVGERYCP